MQTVKTLLWIAALCVDKFTYDEWQSEGLGGQAGYSFHDTDENDKLNARSVPGASCDATCKMSASRQRLLITKYDCV